MGATKASLAQITNGDKSCFAVLSGNSQGKGMAEFPFLQL